jgi:GH15 family glucan-1,4-alpha-glucosidase
MSARTNGHSQHGVGRTHRSGHGVTKHERVKASPGAVARVERAARTAVIKPAIKLPSKEGKTSLRRSPFPPIADYALLSDCEVNALVAPNGSIEWLCVPRHDAPSVFAAMLDRNAGSFTVGVIGTAVPTRRHYIAGSMVLETVWQTSTGWVVVRDALVMTPWRHHAARAAHFRRMPPDWESAAMIVRTIECVYGHVEVQIECAPGFDYGAQAPRWSYSSEGYGEATAASPSAKQPNLVLTTNLHLGLAPRMATARTLLHKGERAFAALSWGDVPAPRTFEEAQERLEATVECWQRWLDRGKFPDHPWKNHLQRSALTIKALTYAPTGALLAAATTSLPETPGGARNWDYRFTWLRDSVYTLRTLTRLGYDTEARDYALFLNDILRPGSDLQIMYGIGGETKLDEKELTHLHGYEGAYPVRIGNGAYDQKQHDVWGNVLLLIGFQANQMGHVPDRAWQVTQESVAAIKAHWKQPDRGIWEVRGEPKHFVSSKVMCWVGADMAAKIADLRLDEDFAAKCRALADQIRTDILENGLDQRGVFTQHYGSRSLDASNLLMATLGFLPGDDPRLRATVLAIADELTIDGLVLRYKVDDTDDGLEGEEGTFCICSFWLVSALVYIGELDRARRLCEKLLAFASPLLLYAEEIDARSGRHLGNFPQAFSHLSMSDALSALIEAERRSNGH